MRCSRCGYEPEEFEQDCARCSQTGNPESPSNYKMQVTPHSGLTDWRATLRQHGGSVRQYGKLYGLPALLLLIAFWKIYTLWQGDSVREAAVRYGLHRSKVDVCLIEVEGSDPSNRLLRRLQSSSVSFKKISASPKLPFCGSILNMEPSKGEVVTSLRLGGIRWYGPFKARIECSWPCGGEEYSLKWTGRWQVTASEQTWVAKEFSNQHFATTSATHFSESNTFSSRGRLL
jgi:hypothetical protein